MAELTLFQTTNLESSKLNHFADNNFTFDKNDRKFFKTLWEKEKIDRYQQFLLFPQCFWKTYTADT